jgi:hypothetical protein
LGRGGTASAVILAGPSDCLAVFEPGVGVIDLVLIAESFKTPRVALLDMTKALRETNCRNLNVRQVAVSPARVVVCVCKQDGWRQCVQTDVEFDKRRT